MGGWPPGPSPRAGNTNRNTNRTLILGLIGAAIAVVLAATATVLVISRQQTVAIVPVGHVTFGDPPVQVRARASTGLPVRLSVVSGPCAAAGDRVRARGAGTCRIRATQDGSDGWHQPASATTTIHVARARQTITFDAPPPKTHGDAPFAVSARASSGLPVTFRAAGACAAGGTAITIEKAGQCSITAIQAGSRNYLPATLTRTVAIAPRSLPNGTVLRQAGGWGGDGQITIDNSQDLDAVMVLTTSDDSPLFSVYVQARQSYTINAINDGSYKMYFEVGSDWDDARGTFDQRADQQVFQDPFTFQTTDDGSFTHYDTYTLTVTFSTGPSQTDPVPKGRFPPVS